MEYQDIILLLEKYLKDNPNPYLYGYRPDDNPNAANENNAFFSDSWRVGGLTGGNCWGGEADEPVETEEEAPLTLLDSFLETYFPTITFLQYRKLLALVQKKTFRSYEYYGNYTEYRISYIKFDELAQCLSDIGIKAVEV